MSWNWYRTASLNQTVLSLRNTIQKNKPAHTGAIKISPDRGSVLPRSLLGFPGFYSAGCDETGLTLFGI